MSTSEKTKNIEMYRPFFVINGNWTGMLIEKDGVLHIRFNSSERSKDMVVRDSNPKTFRDLGLNIAWADKADPNLILINYGILTPGITYVGNKFGPFEITVDEAVDISTPVLLSITSDSETRVTFVDKRELKAIIKEDNHGK